MAQIKRAPLSLLIWMAGKDLTAHPATLGLMVAAVAVGLGLQIPNGANLKGYTAAILEQVTAGYGDVRVRPRGGQRFEDGAGLVARARAVPGAEVALPVLIVAGAVSREGRVASVPVFGLDPRAPHVPFQLFAGPGLDPDDAEGVLLGTTVAARIGAAPGDRVTVQVMLSAAPRLLLGDGGVGRYQMVVRGLVAGNFASYDTAFVSRRFLGGEIGDPDGVSALFVYARDHAQARALADRLAAALPEASARTWTEDAPFLQASVQASATMGGLSETMVLIAVAVPVLALLYINGLARRRQVALLGALGFSRGDLFVSSLLQSVLVGLGGTALGAALGLGLVRYFAARPIFSWDAFVVRPVLTAGVLLHATLVVLVATIVAGLYPAWRAARVDPAPILKDLE